jgi:hypothetical protein
MEEVSKSKRSNNVFISKSVDYKSHDFSAEGAAREGACWCVAHRGAVFRHDPRCDLRTRRFHAQGHVVASSRHDWPATHDRELRSGSTSPPCAFVRRATSGATGREAQERRRRACVTRREYHASHSSIHGLRTALPGASSPCRDHFCARDSKPTHVVPEVVPNRTTTDETTPRVV